MRRRSRSLRKWATQLLHWSHSGRRITITHGSSRRGNAEFARVTFPNAGARSARLALARPPSRPGCSLTDYPPEESHSHETDAYAVDEECPLTNVRVFLARRVPALPPFFLASHQPG